MTGADTQRTKMAYLRHKEEEETGIRTCPKCGVPKPLSEFPLKGKRRDSGKRYGYCKACHSVYQRQHVVSWQYGLTMDEYNSLGDRCAICGRERKTKAMSVDHDHKTGLIRGRLCFRCNRGISWFEDRPELLLAAADYLQNPPAVKVLGREVYGRTGRVTKKRRKK